MLHRLQIFLYTAGIYLYDGGLHLAALFHPKARQMVRGRRQTATVLKQRPAKAGQPTVWFHCASLGEFEQGRPVLEAFKNRHPAYRVVLTFFSPSGYEIRQHYPLADVVCYLPADKPAQVRQFLDLVNPALVFFIKYEFWYHQLRQLHERQVPVFLVSAIFRENQVFFQWYGGFFRQLLGYFRMIFVQNKTSLQLLQTLPKPIAAQRTGDTRFDRVWQIAQQSKTLDPIARFKGDTPLLIVGSAWQEDMAVLIPFLNQFPEKLKVIIAPHEIDPIAMAHWRSSLRPPSVYLSSSPESDLASCDIIFVDSIGLLSSLYRYADFAWIGGAFGKGLHNILEAATFGMPIFFGSKNYRKFQEAQDLIALGGAFVVTDTASFSPLIADFYQNPYRLQSKSALVRQYVADHIGASQYIVEWIDREWLSLNDTSATDKA
jgi:3-deoxy-D-manno-octulosonic-acid transferase